MSQTLKDLEILKAKLSNKGLYKTLPIVENIKAKILKYKTINKYDQASIDQLKFILGRV